MVFVGAFVFEQARHHQLFQRLERLAVAKADRERACCFRRDADGAGRWERRTLHPDQLREWAYAIVFATQSYDTARCPLGSIAATGTLACDSNSQALALAPSWTLCPAVKRLALFDAAL
jgi:hypothetical protein